MSRNDLDVFAELFVKEVRDLAITHCRLKVKRYIEVWKEDGGNLTPQEEIILYRIMIMAIDNRMENYLSLFETGVQPFFLRDRNNKNIIAPENMLRQNLLREKDGWIARFSAYAHQSKMDKR